jgi:hypothetical protein
MIFKKSNEATPTSGRSTAQVIVAGTRQQVDDAVAAAEPLREQLTERGVLILPLPIFDEGGNGSSSANLAPDDMRSCLQCILPVFPWFATHI